MPKVLLREPDLRALEFAATEMKARKCDLGDLPNNPEGKKWNKQVDAAIIRLTDIVDRYNAASLPKPKAEIGYPALVEAAKDVLGRRVMLPPSGAYVIISQIVKRVSVLGISLDDWRAACKTAGMRWQGNIRLESLARQADKLLADVVDTGKAEVPAVEEWNDLSD